MPYLKIIALTVTEIRAGPKILKVGHVTLTRPTSPNFAFITTLHALHATRSRDEKAVC